MNIELKNSEGLAALQLGDYETALKIFEECLTYDPSSPILLYNKGLTLLYMYRDWETDRKSTRLNSSHSAKSRMPSSA